VEEKFFCRISYLPGSNVLDSHDMAHVNKTHVSADNFLCIIVLSNLRRRPQ
jgi:hypothetical protein